jgi:hypothetical protein
LKPILSISRLFGNVLTKEVFLSSFIRVNLNSHAYYQMNNVDLIYTAFNTHIRFDERSLDDQIRLSQIIARPLTHVFGKHLEKLSSLPQWKLTDSEIDFFEPTVDNTSEKGHIVIKASKAVVQIFNNTFAPIYEQLCHIYGCEAVAKSPYFKIFTDRKATLHTTTLTITPALPPASKTFDLRLLCEHVKEVLERRWLSQKDTDLCPDAIFKRTQHQD